MSEATITTDHDEIRRWAEARGARPAIIGAGQGAGGILRFDFGDDDARLAEVPWDEFFRVFDDNQLALLRQEETVSGQQSRFFKFIDRNTSSGVNHDAEMAGETRMSNETDETDHEPMIEGQTDKGTGRRQSPAQDAEDSGMAGMNAMEDNTASGMDEEQGRSRRSTSRRPAAKRSSSNRTSARSGTGRSSSSGTKRGASSRKSGRSKTRSASSRSSSSRSTARKTASRKAAAKKSAAKRTSGSRRSSASTSRSRTTKRAPARRSR